MSKNAPRSPAKPPQIPDHLDTALNLDKVRQCAAEAGLTEIAFSKIARMVSFSADVEGKAVRINIYWTTATVGTCALNAADPASSARAQQKPKTDGPRESGAAPSQQFFRNVTMRRLREIMLDPVQKGGAKNRLAAQMESGVLSLERYLKGDC